MPQLVSEESGETVAVPAGKTMVGRGSLLKIADKRVSRNHALLEWKEQSLKLCSKHVNPCFHRPAGQDKFSPVMKDECAELHHGDCISFLPGSAVFQVVWEEEEGKKGGKEEGEGEMTKDVDGEQKEGGGKEEEEEERTEGEVRGSSPSQVTAGGPSDTLQETGRSLAARSSSPPATGEGCGPPVPAPKKEETGGSTGRRRVLPAWLTAVRTEPRPPAAAAKPDKPATSKPTASKPTPTARKPATSKPAAKRKARDVPEGEEEEEEEEEERAPPPAKRPARPAKPKVSSEGSSLSGRATAAEKGGGEGGGGGGADSRLPPCPYGTACYRKNPAHFKEYSHDTDQGDEDSVDSEGESDDRPVCPYGAECYRTNPAHRREFRHSDPPAKRHSGKRGSRRSARKTKPRVSALQEDSDDDGEPNTYDYTDSFIDDAGASSDDSTSYGGDSEDSDWAPASGSEDVRELVKDAKDFLGNKKMWKPA